MYFLKRCIFCCHVLVWRKLVLWVFGGSCVCRSFGWLSTYWYRIGNGYLVQFVTYIIMLCTLYSSVVLDLWSLVRSHFVLTERIFRKQQHLSILKTPLRADVPWLNLLQTELWPLWCWNSYVFVIIVTGGQYLRKDGRGGVVRWPSVLDFPGQSFISGSCPGFQCPGFVLDLKSSDPSLENVYLSQ